MVNEPVTHTTLEAVPQTAPHVSVQALGLVQHEPAAAAAQQRRRGVLMFTLAALISVVALGLSIYFHDALAALGQLGLAGLFILSVIGNATVFIPLPAFVVACAAAPIYGALATGLVSGIGAAVGEMTGYIAGYGGTAIVPQGKLYRRLHTLMKRYGPLVVFCMAALPNPLFDAVGLSAGALKMPPMIFLAATAAGRMLRLTIVTYACRGTLPALMGVFGGGS